MLDAGACRAKAWSSGDGRLPPAGSGRAANVVGAGFREAKAGLADAGNLAGKLGLGFMQGLQAKVANSFDARPAGDRVRSNPP
jgi:hypothetical protein